MLILLIGPCYIIMCADNPAQNVSVHLNTWYLDEFLEDEESYAHIRMQTLHVVCDQMRQICQHVVHCLNALFTLSHAYNFEMNLCSMVTVFRYRNQRIAVCVAVV